MLSLAIIRVEPGSTPGIGITITEYFLFASFVFCGMFVAFRKVPSHSCSSGAGNFFYTYCYYIHTYRYLVLGTTYYIKSDNVDKENGHTGGTYLIFPPSWPPATCTLTIGTTETTS